MVRLILGRAGAGKTGLVFDEIAGYVRQGVGGSILLVPEQYSHEAERELCAAAGDTLSRYGEVLSFTGLARKVFSQVGGGRTVMDGAGRLLCMAVAVHDVSDGLRFYRRARQDARVLDSLVRAAEELENAGLDAAALADAAGKTQGVLSDKLADMALLLEAYAAVRERGGADPADRLASLAELIAESPVVRGRFYVDGFSDFTELEKRVLTALVRAGAELTVCLTCGREDAGGVFELPRQTARWLADMAEQAGVPCSQIWLEPPLPEDDPVAFFCGHLFDFSPAQAPASDGAVTAVSAPDIAAECELAAARMAQLARQGCRWRDMAVAVRGFSDYRTALESACARYGVPLFLSGRGDTLQKNLPLAVVSALEAVLRGYEYEAVFSYLKTGLGPIPLEDVDRLENYVLLWSIRGGQWDRPWVMHPEGYGRPMDEAAEQALEQLNDMRRAVIGPLKALERRVERASTAAELAAALADFLTRSKLDRALERRQAELLAEGRRETAAECARLWDTVCTALEQFAALLGDMSMDAEQFQGLFDLMLSKYDVNVIPVSLDRVGAGDIDGMRRRHLRHLLLLGASDGRIPAPDDGAGAFTADERETLTALGLPMGGAELDMARELGRIYSVLSLPSESLYMSWSESDGEGGQGRPSVLVDRAKALLGVVPARGDLVQARTWSGETAFALALEGQTGGRLPEHLAARAWFVQAGQEPELARLAGAARAAEGSLSAPSVRSLYGERPVLTATRAEKFADCRFGYFLQYGLKAKPRQQAVFDPRDYGNFMHTILENTARAVLDEGGFAAVTDQRVGQLADQFVDKYISDEMHGLADRTARFAYLFRRLRTTVRQVVTDMWQELRQSQFQPLDLELDLRAEGVLEPAEDETPLAGRADRVDGWVRDGVLYLRVTDYKTGKKSFDLADVCQGINMQMLLYLFTLQKRGAGHFGAQTIRPAGVLYSPARFEMIDAAGKSPEQIARERRDSSRRSGLLLDDDEVLQAMEPGQDKRFLPVKLTRTGGVDKRSAASLASLERFGSLSRFIDKTLQDLADQLRAGSVAADPWYKSSRENACAWCDFRQACLFDRDGDGWRVRVDMSAEDAWKRIESDGK